MECNTLCTADQTPFVLDYLPNSGTIVKINNTKKGTIPGGDFNRALLAVWLGEEPADPDLISGLLGK